MMNIEKLSPGLAHTSVMTVAQQHTAAAIGSGDMQVLSTPIMMALMENAAMLAVDQHLTEEQTTVGAYIEASHLRPSPVGAEIVATAQLTSVDGRKLTFRVAAMQGDTVIGEGTHVRYIVDRARFLDAVGGAAE